MKALIISDTHFHNWPEFAEYSRGYSSRLELQLETFKQALDIGRKHKCEMLIHLGDVFHTRGKVEPEVVNLVKKALETNGDYLRDIRVLTGNHDITAEGPVFNTAHILNGFMDERIHVIAEPMRLDGVLYIPFMKEGFEDAVKELLGSGKASLHPLCIHQSVFGAEYNRPIVKGVDPLFLKPFAGTWCGHIHQPQELPYNIHIVGAPYPMNFGDNYSGFAFVSSMVKGNLHSRFPLKHPRFLTVRKQSDINNYDFFRLQTAVSPGEQQSNVRVQMEVKTKKLVRVKTKSDRDLLRHYIESTGGMEGIPGELILETGMKLLGDANDG